MHQYPARLVELDPATGKPKRRTWNKPTVRRLSDMNLAGTKNVLRLYEVARDHRSERFGDAVFVRSLRLGIPQRSGLLAACARRRHPQRAGVVRPLLGTAP